MNFSKKNKKFSKIEELRIDPIYQSDNLFGFPEVKKTDFNFKGKIYSVAFGNRVKRFNSILHFFVDDFKFESVFNNLANGLKTISRKKIKYVCAPDFSMYQDWPHSVNIFNIYKNRLITRYWQENSHKNIIPSVSWSNPESYQYCFDGLPKKGIFSLTHFVKDDGDWHRGFIKFYEKCEPDKIAVFGIMPNFDFRDRFECDWTLFG